MVSLLFRACFQVSPCIKKANEIGFDESNIHAGYSEKKLEQDLAEGPFDCIVVGSGIGGLTTAAMLSRRGKRVLVLEQHDVIGDVSDIFIEAGITYFLLSQADALIRSRRKDMSLILAFITSEVR